MGSLQAKFGLSVNTSVKGFHGKYNLFNTKSLYPKLCRCVSVLLWQAVLNHGFTVNAYLSLNNTGTQIFKILSHEKEANDKEIIS